MAVDQSLDRPALIFDSTGTIVIEPEWSARSLKNGHLILTRLIGVLSPVPESNRASSSAPDPAKLELFNNLFTAVAEEMGLQLQKTSHSVNIKERLDFSCAIFDSEGRLIANAPHMPVHLGSMGESVHSLISSNSSSSFAPEMRSCSIIHITAARICRTLP